jgi:hypothetical protein
MKWKKLGKIFDPTEHKLPNNCFEYAKSPQTIVYNDFIRIYFSTIEKDKTGKYLSHIAFVDFEKNFQSIIDISKDPIVHLGELGCFDEHGIFPINVLRNEDKIYAYITGWSRRKSVSVETSIGLAISNDNGKTFKKFGNGPVLTSSLHEPFLVCDGFVVKYDNIFHMWYIFGTKWIEDTPDKTPERVYKIGHAISDDGIDWKREGRQLISDRLNANESQALPTVIYYKGIFHMYFCYRQSINFRKSRINGYRLGYAYSQDLKYWLRDDDNAGIDLSVEGWDSEMMCYPHLFEYNDNIYLLYNYVKVILCRR